MSDIADIVIRQLTTHPDDRGSLTEIRRDSWGDGPAPVQWNLVHSAADVVRGVHVHPTHDDYLVVVGGTMYLGLQDLRRDSPTYGAAVVEVLGGQGRVTAAYVPSGVAHGFHFPEPSTHVYGVTHYWNLADELACRWDDPDLGFRFDTTSPLLSDRDRAAGSLAEMEATYRAALATSP